MEYKLIHFMQKYIFKAKNSDEPLHLPGTLNIDGIYNYHNDILYDSCYPNHFLDVYERQDAGYVKYPTIIFVHGGGFVWGDKSEYAPNPKREDSDWYFKSFLKAGYNVVCVNYAFAPEYTYPMPVYQLNDALRFLLNVGKQWNLDMDRVIFAGNSAGAHIVGQYANIQTNPTYAHQMGLQPLLSVNQIKAMIINSGLLDIERFGETGDKSTDNLFTKCGKTYFNCSELYGNPRVRKANIINYVTENFPPVFISDGNTATFFAQARDLDERLNELNVPHELNIYGIQEQKLRHDYERKNDKYGQDNMKKMLLYLENVKEYVKDT